MKITCLVTAQPAEGESVEVEFTGVSYWQEQLLRVLEVLDTRLSGMNRTLVDDLVQADRSLSPEEYDALIDIINIQFPFYGENIPLTFDDVRVLVRKMTNHREQIALRFDLSKGEDIRPVLARAFDLLDKRMIETNERDLAAHELFQTFNPEMKQKLQMILDCLYGRADARYVALQLASHALVKEKEALEQEKEALKEAILEGSDLHITPREGHVILEEAQEQGDVQEAQNVNQDKDMGPFNTP